jgi:hypothetical protein
LLLARAYGDAEILSTSASVRPDNSLIVDVQVMTGGNAAQIQVSYRTEGADPLVSPLRPVSAAGPTTITVGRLRANRKYTYSVRAFDDHGAPAGTANGNFMTGSLPAALLTNTYSLQGRSTVPLVIVPHTQPDFRGYVGFDLHSDDAPQIVWYYSNAPSNASGTLQVDTVASMVQQRHGTFLIADAGSGPGPLAADSFYREIAPDGTLVAESPATCSVTRPAASAAAAGWIWGQGNDIHEQLVSGADGVPGTVLHLAKIVKDPFFEAGLAPQGARLQAGIGIRRWNPATGSDELVWDPFRFLNPLTDRTNEGNSDPGAHSNTVAAFPCAGASLQIEEWMHSNSLQVAPTGVILMSVRHLDTVLAISPQFDRIAWRLGRFGSSFSFPKPSDRFYHQHFARMLQNGNLLLLDNGNGRPPAEGGLYTRALELALDWNSMTASKVWEYRHPLGPAGGPPDYKYADKVGAAQRLENGNTLVWYGADIDPATRMARDPQILTLVEASATGEAVAVLDMQITGNNPAYRAVPVKTLFGEVVGTN